ncbi:hypothetical protein L6258_00475 [Candidatus Parcubacteria bacterium]|nr:hypothetical protein [Candidatus Parcubacteria bacterium]
MEYLYLVGFLVTELGFSTGWVYILCRSYLWLQERPGALLIRQLTAMVWGATGTVAWLFVSLCLLPVLFDTHLGVGVPSHWTSDRYETLYWLGLAGALVGGIVLGVYWQEKVATRNGAP